MPRRIRTGNRASDKKLEKEVTLLINNTILMRITNESRTAQCGDWWAFPRAEKQSPVRSGGVPLAAAAAAAALAMTFSGRPGKELCRSGE